MSRSQEFNGTATMSKLLLGSVHMHLRATTSTPPVNRQEHCRIVASTSSFRMQQRLPCWPITLWEQAHEHRSGSGDKVT